MTAMICRSYLSKLRLTPNSGKGKRLFLAAYTLLACLPGILAIYYATALRAGGPIQLPNVLWGKEDKEITII